MKEVKTRFDEVKFRTSDVTKMQGMYLAESVYQKWKEDFLDESTGEVVTVDRNSCLFARGTKVTPDIATQIQFHQQCGDITEDILVSDQLRGGRSINTSTNGNPYLVKVTMMNGKKRKFILHATSVAMANEIMKDYGELEMEDGFQISSIQEAEKFVVIEDNLRTMTEVENGETGAELETDNEDFEPKFYKIDTKCEILVNEVAVNEFESSFLVFAQDAEQGKELIGRFMDDYLAKDKKECDPDKTCQLTILAAAVYQCNKIISRQFCKAYIDQKDWTGPIQQLDASNSENGHVQWHRNTPEDLPDSDDKQLLVVMKGSDQVMFSSTIDGKLLPDVEFWSYVDTTAIEYMRAERSEDETE